MTLATAFLIALAAVAWLLFVARLVLVAARMLQIEEYEAARFLRWGMTRAWLLHRSVVVAAVCGVAGLIVAAITSATAARIADATAWLVAGAAASALWTWLPPKKALVLTSRMRRILAVSGVVAAVAAALVALVLARAPVAGCVLVLAAVALAPLFAQVLLLCANVLLIPVEAMVRRRYLLRARARIRAVNPFVVAVAGSYGKTSTKHILAQLLQPSVTALPTRKSFNTLMGVTRVINEDLEQRHRVFIVEMDAYAPGEIAAMCRLVEPRVAVITAVGPQHLERFGSIDRIAAALYEAVAALPRDGAAFIAAESAETARLATSSAAEGRVTVTYGISDVGAAMYDVCASQVHLDASGAAFHWEWKARGLSRDVRIPLLGVHQVSNVTVALAVIAHLGHDLDAAVRAAAELPPVEHRLQPLRNGPITVIDDSYNANPVGVHNGLDVLALMDAPHKVLVTPGLVELGAVEEQENRRYGEHAARVCDAVIVMDAKPASALREGLRAGGLADSAVHVARTLDEATALIQRLTRPGDVVLFANDLPDTYLAAS